jgi:hypothetical protein
MFANYSDGLNFEEHYPQVKVSYVRLGKGRLGEDVHVQYAYLLNYIFHQMKVCIP